MATIVLLVLGCAVAFNLTLLSAMVAGRSDRAGLRSVLLAVELAFFLAATLSAVAAGLVVAGDLGWHVERRDGRVAFTALGALVVGAPLGYALAYLEYRLAGKAPMFRLDLRRSLWLTKSGVQRWDSRES